MTTAGGGATIGIDIGGTFTDVVLIHDGRMHCVKIPSSPPQYEGAVVRGIRMVLDASRARPEEVDKLAHGTTVATNALLEARGARTALVTTRGFRDVLELGRGRRPSMADVFWKKPVPLVPRRRRLEFAERITARGEVEQPVDPAELADLTRQLDALAPESVAVAFINSYRNPAHEIQVAQWLRDCYPKLHVTASVEITPEIKEFERTSTAVVNAYVQPIVADYLAALEQEASRMGVNAPLLVAQSNGALTPSVLARTRPVRIVESGPAAGVIAAQRLGTDLGLPNVIAFDMGGTTAKASLIENGEPFVAADYEVGAGMNSVRRLLGGGGYTIRASSIEIAEVGAGGGSICWIDDAGLPHVGPQSAGADPGPACYGLGGTDATITDSNLVLGYLNPAEMAGGVQRLDQAGAEAAVRDAVARPLGLALHEAAFGIHQIATTTMSRAIKAVTSERGRDPRDFALIAFGGAGPAHAVAVARECGIPTVVVPARSGVFSAVGLTMSTVTEDDAWSYGTPGEWRPDEISSIFQAMEERTTARLSKATGHDGPFTTQRFADLRYRGQSSELRGPLPDGPVTPETLARVRNQFEEEYERTYGHRGAGEGIELVSLRLTASPVTEDRPDLGCLAQAGEESQRAESTRRAYFGADHGEVATSVLLTRAGLSARPRSGPLVIEEPDTTVVVPPSTTAHRDQFGNIVVEVGSDA